MTGYLTIMRPPELSAREEGKPALGRFALKIPNREIADIFKKHVRSWFAEKTALSDRRELFAALWAGDETRLTGILSDLLFDTISYHDYREIFYHAFLVGLVSNAGYRVESNYENEDGRSDIIIRDRKNRRAVVIEAKAADSERGMEKACENALQQIEEKQYAKAVERSGYKQAGRLGIAFWKKKCLVRAGGAGKGGYRRKGIKRKELCRRHERLQKGMMLVQHREKLSWQEPSESDSGGHLTTNNAPRSFTSLN